MRSITAPEFKNRCLAVLEDIERTRRPMVVTRRGKPIARIGPTTTDFGAPGHNPLKGSIEFQDDLVAPIEGAWKATASDRIP